MAVLSKKHTTASLCTTACLRHAHSQTQYTSELLKTHTPTKIAANRNSLSPPLELLAPAPPATESLPPLAARPTNACLQAQTHQDPFCVLRRLWAAYQWPLRGPPLFKRNTYCFSTAQEVICPCSEQSEKRNPYQGKSRECTLGSLWLAENHSRQNDMQKDSKTQSEL